MVFTSIQKCFIKLFECLTYSITLTIIHTNSKFGKGSPNVPYFFQDSLMGVVSSCKNVNNFQTGIQFFITIQMFSYNNCTLQAHVVEWWWLRAKETHNFKRSSEPLMQLHKFHILEASLWHRSGKKRSWWKCLREPISFVPKTDWDRSLVSYFRSSDPL